MSALQLTFVKQVPLNKLNALMGSISLVHNNHLVFHAQQVVYARQVYKLIVLQENFAPKDQATANSVSMDDKTKNQ